MAARNVAKAVEMASTGQYRDAKGNKVMDVDLMDAGVKSVGFQPGDVAKGAGRPTAPPGHGRQRPACANRNLDEVGPAPWPTGSGRAAGSASDDAGLEQKNPATPIRASNSGIF